MGKSRKRMKAGGQNATAGAATVATRSEDIKRGLAAKKSGAAATNLAIPASSSAVDSAAPQCSICLEPISEAAGLLPCGHHYHGHCIQQWLVEHGDCPVCRQSISVDADGIDVRVRPSTDKSAVKTPRQTVLPAAHLALCPIL